MIHLQITQRSFSEVCDRMASACQSQGYGVLAQHNDGETLRSKGIDYSGQCIVFEICQPVHAAAILKADPTLASGLPCRVAISQTDSGEVMLSMCSPERLFRDISSKAEVLAIAQQVEEETRPIIGRAAYELR